MGLIELIIVVLLIVWLFGGIALPLAGSLLNILLFVVICWIIYKLLKGRRIE